MKCETLTTPNDGEDLEQQELLFIADRNAKCYSHFEKPSSTTLESKTCIYHIIFSIPLLGTCPRKINTYTHTKTYSQLRVSDVG